MSKSMNIALSKPSNISNKEDFIKNNKVEQAIKTENTNDNKKHNLNNSCKNSIHLNNLSQFYYQNKTKDFIIKYKLTNNNKTIKIKHKKDNNTDINYNKCDHNEIYFTNNSYSSSINSKSREFDVKLHSHLLRKLYIKDLPVLNKLIINNTKSNKENTSFVFYLKQNYSHKVINKFINYFYFRVIEINDEEELIELMNLFFEFGNKEVVNGCLKYIDKQFYSFSKEVFFDNIKITNENSSKALSFYNKACIGFDCLGCNYINKHEDNNKEDIDNDYIHVCFSNKSFINIRIRNRNNKCKNIDNLLYELIIFFEKCYNKSNIRNSDGNVIEPIVNKKSFISILFKLLPNNNDNTDNNSHRDSFSLILLYYYNMIFSIITNSLINNYLIFSEQFNYYLIEIYFFLVTYMQDYYNNSNLSNNIIRYYKIMLLESIVNNTTLFNFITSNDLENNLTPSYCFYNSKKAFITKWLLSLIKDSEVADSICCKDNNGENRYGDYNKRVKYIIEYFEDKDNSLFIVNESSKKGIEIENYDDAYKNTNKSEKYSSGEIIVTDYNSHYNINNKNQTTIDRRADCKIRVKSNEILSFVKRISILESEIVKLKEVIKLTSRSTNNNNYRERDKDKNRDNSALNYETNYPTNPFTNNIINNAIDIKNNSLLNAENKENAENIDSRYDLNEIEDEDKKKEKTDLHLNIKQENKNYINNKDKANDIQCKSISKKNNKKLSNKTNTNTSIKRKDDSLRNLFKNNKINNGITIKTSSSKDSFIDVQTLKKQKIKTNTNTKNNKLTHLRNLNNIKDENNYNKKTKSNDNINKITNINVVNTKTSINTKSSKNSNNYKLNHINNKEFVDYLNKININNTDKNKCDIILTRNKENNQSSNNHSKIEDLLNDVINNKNNLDSNSGEKSNNSKYCSSILSYKIEINNNNNNSIKSKKNDHNKDFSINCNENNIINCNEDVTLNNQLNYTSNFKVMEANKIENTIKNFPNYDVNSNEEDSDDVCKENSNVEINYNLDGFTSNLNCKLDVNENNYKNIIDNNDNNDTEGILDIDDIDLDDYPEQYISDIISQIKLPYYLTNSNHSNIKSFSENIVRLRNEYITRKIKEIIIEINRKYTNNEYDEANSYNVIEYNSCFSINRQQNNSKELNSEINVFEHNHFNNIANNNIISSNGFSLNNKDKDNNYNNHNNYNRNYIDYIDNKDDRDYRNSNSIIINTINANNYMICNENSIFLHPSSSKLPLCQDNDFESEQKNKNNYYNDSKSVFNTTDLKVNNEYSNIYYSNNSNYNNIINVQTNGNTGNASNMNEIKDYSNVNISNNKVSINVNKNIPPSLNKKIYSYNKEDSVVIGNNNYNNTNNNTITNTNNTKREDNKEKDSLVTNLINNNIHIDQVDDELNNNNNDANNNNKEDSDFINISINNENNNNNNNKSSYNINNINTPVKNDYINKSLINCENKNYISCNYNDHISVLEHKKPKIKKINKFISHSKEHYSNSNSNINKNNYIINSKSVSSLKKNRLYNLLFNNNNRDDNNRLSNVVNKNHLLIYKKLTPNQPLYLPKLPYKYIKSNNQNNDKSGDNYKKKYSLCSSYFIKKYYTSNEENKNNGCISEDVDYNEKDSIPKMSADNGNNDSNDDIRLKYANRTKEIERNNSTYNANIMNIVSKANSINNSNINSNYINNTNINTVITYESIKNNTNNISNPETKEITITDILNSKIIQKNSSKHNLYELITNNNNKSINNNNNFISINHIPIKKFSLSHTKVNKYNTSNKNDNKNEDIALKSNSYSTPFHKNINYNSCNIKNNSNKNNNYQRSTREERKAFLTKIQKDLEDKRIKKEKTKLFMKLLFQDSSILNNNTRYMEFLISKIIQNKNTNNISISNNTDLLAKIKTIKQIKKIFDSKTNSDSSKTFHDITDFISPTLTLIKLKSINIRYNNNIYNSIIGGYTFLDFSGKHYKKNDSYASLFSMSPNHLDKYVCVKQKNVVFCNPRYGPCFGGGFDLRIYDGFLNSVNGENKSFSKLGHSYVHEDKDKETPISLDYIKISKKNININKSNDISGVEDLYLSNYDSNVSYTDKYNNELRDIIGSSSKYASNVNVNVNDNDSNSNNLDVKVNNSFFNNYSYDYNIDDKDCDIFCNPGNILIDEMEVFHIIFSNQTVEE